MAQDWIGLMKKVPWKTVAEAAPAIADAARRLGKRIDAVRESAEAQADAPAAPPKPPPPATDAGVGGPDRADEDRRAVQEATALLGALQAKVDGLERRQAELAANLEQAARLVGELGEQNGRMAQAQEAMAGRLDQVVKVAWGAMGLAVVAIAVASVALLR